MKTITTGIDLAPPRPLTRVDIPHYAEGPKNTPDVPSGRPRSRQSLS
jgi:hypothetical protein